MMGRLRRNSSKDIEEAMAGGLNKARIPLRLTYSGLEKKVPFCFVHVCYVQVTTGGATDADAPRCAHFSIVITPSWITEKCQ